MVRVYRKILISQASLLISGRNIASKIINHIYEILILPVGHNNITSKIIIFINFNFLAIYSLN